MAHDLIILGRGPSAFGFDWHSWTHCDLMAVSSGVFAVPEGRSCQHFVSMDHPKYFVHGITRTEISWGEDDKARHWPFWSDESIVKHTTSYKNKPGHFRSLPTNLLRHIPQQHHEAFAEALLANQHMVGFQPGWGDFANVRGWDITYQPHASWNDGPISTGELRNSLMLAPQIAYRLGYRTMHFVGVDFNLDGYAEHRARLREWYADLPEDCTWTNLSPTSSLAEFIPTIQHARAV